jgi:NTE family protein
VSVPFAASTGGDGVHRGDFVSEGNDGEIPLRIGVALGAGSAAALAEIGALEALIGAGISLSCVAGTSAGAVVGAALAAGRLHELRKSLEGLTRGRVMRLFDPAWPRQGLLHGRRALELLSPDLGDRIETLTMPFAAVATDLRSGDEVMLDQGPVFDAVRASMAVPGVFTPWRIDGRLLVDGGLVDPVPVTVARALGAEFVIALNVLPLRGPPKHAGVLQERLRMAHAPETQRHVRADEPVDDHLGLVEIVWHASQIFSSEVATHRLREDRPGWLLQIPVPETGMFDLHRTGELVEIGRRAAERRLPELRRALRRAIPLRRRLREWPRRIAEHFATS